MKADRKDEENFQGSKKKLKSQGDKRPITSDLTGYKSLQAKLQRIENQTHPLDRSNPFKIYFLCYVWPIISLAKRAIVSQNAHYKLPKKERISSSKVRLANGLYGTPIPDWSRKGEEPPEVEDPHSETKYSKELQMPILKAFFSRYLWKTTSIIFIYIIIHAVMFFKVYAIKEALDTIDHQLKEYGQLIDKAPILMWFAVIWFGNVFQEASFNFIWVDRSRLTLRLTGSLYSIVYEKLLRIGVVNYHEHEEGSIINYLQNDITKFEEATWALKHVVSFFVNIALSVFMGIFFFNWVFLVLIAGILILVWINSIIMKKLVDAENNWSKATDVRLNLLKNVLRNLKFIKIGVFENLFLKRVNDKRANEVFYLIKASFYGGCLFFAYIIGNAAIIVSFLYCYFLSGLTLDVGSVTVLLNIFGLLQNALFGIPYSITTITDIFVSMRRLKLFLESKEVEFGRVKQEPNPSSLYAVEIKDGCFYWDKRISKEESEKIREEKLEEMKRGKKKGKRDGNKIDEEVITTTSSALRKTLLTTATDETMKGDYEQTDFAKRQDVEEGRRFGLKNLNFRAERGKLTVIIGKIGSGKSSLLYSLLGEMRIGDYARTKVHVNGSICYCLCDEFYKIS